MAKIAENKMQRRRLNNFFLLRACARPQRSGGKYWRAIIILAFIFTGIFFSFFVLFLPVKILRHFFLYFARHFIPAAVEKSAEAK